MPASAEHGLDQLRILAVGSERENAPLQHLFFLDLHCLGLISGSRHALVHRHAGQYAAEFPQGLSDLECPCSR